MPPVLPALGSLLTGSGWMTLGILPLLMAALTVFRYNELDPESRPTNTKTLFRAYDFIVIGAGSAGAVVANRLSENPDWKILLIEAGGDENEISDIPSLAGYLQLSELDWKYKTEPPMGDNAYCLAMVGDRCNWPRGKVLGGSSVLNAMIYVRGNRHDYDQWESLGNPGWGYKDVLPYFKKSEDNRNAYLLRTPYHSKGGYLTVQESPWHSPLAAAFVEAGEELGYENRDTDWIYDCSRYNQARLTLFYGQGFLTSHPAAEESPHSDGNASPAASIRQVRSCAACSRGGNCS
uniref:Glucose dehydrogenase [FAD, quinone] n=1 Tax=Cacopsylla melanoneura TaxID=428564 RepID=A0A8D8TCL7_9HEMI